MISEVAPPGWGHTKAEKEKTKPNKPKSKIGGTADAMKKAQKRGDIPKNMNIFALMWSMKNKGDKPHYKPGVKDVLKKKYKGPKGQNEEKADEKPYPPTRLFKNVPNSVVKKANKEADKVKKEQEKAVLGEPPTSGPSGASMHSKDNVYEDEKVDMVSLVAQAIKKEGTEGDALVKAVAKSPKQQALKKKQMLNITSAGKKALKKGDHKLSITPKGKAAVEDMSLAPKGKGRKAAKALYKEGGQDIQSRHGSHVAGKKGISLDKLSPSTLAAIRKQRAQKRQDREAKRSWKRPIGQAEEVELDEIGFAQAGKRASANAIARGRAKEKEADDRELALKKKVSITQKGLDALRRDRDRPKVKTQVKITKKGRDAIRDEVEVDEGNVKGKGEWMPYLGQHSGEKERADKQKKREAQAKDKRNQNKDPVGKQHEEMVEKISRKLREVAPPGWGHTKAEKSKTHPEKPKSKIGGSIEAMKKAQERGDIPKDMNIFALANSMRNKGANPHYKPGEKGVLKKKYRGPKGQNEESILEAATRYVIDERADWETAFKSASQSRPAMKYKDAAAFIDTAGLSSTEKRTALKSAKKWLK